MQIAIFPSALDRIVHEDYSNVTRWLRRVGADFGGADYRPDMIIAWKQKQKKKTDGARVHCAFIQQVLLMFSTSFHTSEIRGPGGELRPEHLQDDYPHS